MTPDNPLTRRRFLTLGGGTALWVVAGCRAGSPDALTPPTTTTSTITPTTTSAPTPGPEGTGLPPVDERVLVVVQLLGGNDALNTVVPSTGRYRDERPTVVVDEADLVALSGRTDFGLHPSLAPLSRHWDAGTLGIAAGVAFSDQTRSHFTSRDVWWRASSDASEPGWLARWIDAAAIDGPDDPLEAIALGVGPRALAGSSASAVNDPSDFVLRPPGPMSDAEFEQFLLAVSDTSGDESALMAAARGSLPATLSVQKILEDLGDDAAGDAYLDRNEPALHVQLQTAATLIRSRPGLRVVTVGIEGFDTHAGQLTRHRDLLDGAATALDEFWDALRPEDRDRTMILTTSEFGRRVAENGSGGTDHGTAGVQLLMGAGVNGGEIVGGYDFDHLVNGDLPTVVQGESLFADALRWLGGPVAEVLGHDPEPTGLAVV